MGHVIEVSDEAYQNLSEMAADQGQTPESLIELWIAYQLDGYRQAQHDPNAHPRFYTTDAWFRHLGMSDEEIAEADAQLQADEATEARGATGADAR